METYSHFVVAAFMIITFYSCNADVFINEIDPSVSELTLDGNGETATIRFKSSDYNYNAYDATGALLGEYASVDGNGKIVCNDAYTNFTIERTAGNELTITVNEHVTQQAFRVDLVVSNEYESKVVNVTILPGDRYEIERIVYDAEASLYTDNYVEQSKSMVVHNTSDQPVGWIVHPYRDQFRSVTFISDRQDDFMLLEASSPCSVTIPEIENGKIQVKSEKAFYTAESQELPLPFVSDEEKSITIPPYRNQRVTLYIGYEWFETRYTLYAVHPKTGKKRTITGTFKSKTPNGYWVTRENLD